MDAPDHRERFVKSFREPAVPRTVLFADIADFTAYKQNHGDVWLMTLGAMLDIMEPHLLAHGGEIVKYLGDGALAAFEVEHAAEAINSAIEIQEAVSKLNHPQGNGQRNLSACWFKIGIATGPVRRFETAQGTSDYVGSPVDLAQRLCQAANAQAIWVDLETKEEARISQVQCQLGNVQGRRGRDLLGPEETISLKGFPGPMSYREVIWSAQKFGVAGDAVTEVTNRLASATVHRTQVGPTRASASAKPLDGTLSWRQEKRHGFIHTDDDQWYYTDSRYIVDMAGARTGARAHFVPRPPNQEGKHPVAAATVFEGQEVTGWVIRINHTGHFCFIATFDSEDNKIELFHHLGDNPLGLKVDDEIRFKVTETPKGLQATQVSKVSPDNQAA